MKQAQVKRRKANKRNKAAEIEQSFIKKNKSNRSKENVQEGMCDCSKPRDYRLLSIHIKYEKRK